jgi:hypothetical protein
MAAGVVPVDISGSVQLTGGAASGGTAAGGSNRANIYNVSGSGGVFLWVGLAAVIYGVVWIMKKK